MSRRPGYEWSPEEDERLRVMWKFGYSIKVLANKMFPNRSYGAVMQRVRALNLPPMAEQRAKYGSPEWRLIEFELFTAQLTKREMAERTGLSINVVRHTLKQCHEHVSVVGKKNGENVYRLGKRKIVPPFE